MAFFGAALAKHGHDCTGSVLDADGIAVFGLLSVRLLSRYSHHPQFLMIQQGCVRRSVSPYAAVGMTELCARFAMLGKNVFYCVLSADRKKQWLENGHKFATL